MQSLLAMPPDVRLQHIDKMAHLALPLYGLEPDTELKLLNHSENTTYLVKGSNGSAPTILRINRPGYHTPKTLEAELAWLKSLIDDSPIITALPIPGADGAVIQRINHPEYEEELNCAMFEFLSGEAPEENEATLVEEFKKLGAVTAQLHLHVKTWDDSPCLNRPHWNYHYMLGDEPRWGRWQDGIDVTEERAAVFQRVADVIKNRLDAYGMGPDRYGLIHADLRLANLLVEHGKVKVIDFDDCGFGWFLYDLGAALSFIEHEPYVPDLIEAWVEGYRTVAYLSPEDEAEIPTFVMLRRLMLVAWLGSHYETEISQQIGKSYTATSMPLAEAYLKQFE